MAYRRGRRPVPLGADCAPVKYAAPLAARFTIFYNPLRWLDTLGLTGLYSLARVRSE